MSRYQFYKSKEWENLLKVIKLDRVNENGDIICEHCGKPIIKKYDCIGHHKIELTEANYTDVSISLNPDNIALVHHRCHNIIHNKLGYGQREVYLVYGAPLSGKSTYANAVANKGDLILDLDRIWWAVSGCDIYVHPDRLKSNVFGLRNELLRQIQYRQGKWLNAYVVGGYPLSAERERLISQLGAREVFIDTPIDICMERLAKDKERDTIEWIGYINDWFDKYNGKY